MDHFIVRVDTDQFIHSGLVYVTICTYECIHYGLAYANLYMEMNSLGVTSYIDSSSIYFFLNIFTPSQYPSYIALVRRAIYDVHCTTYHIRRTVYDVQYTCVRRTLYMCIWMNSKTLLLYMRITVLRTYRKTSHAVILRKHKNSIHYIIIIKNRNWNSLLVLG